jgi:hypothetical protein
MNPEIIMCSSRFFYENLNNNKINFLLKAIDWVFLEFETNQTNQNHLYVPSYFELLLQII